MTNFVLQISTLACATFASDLYSEDERIRRQEEAIESHSPEVLTTLFRNYDKNLDGVLDVSEIGSQIKMTSEKLFQYFLNLDTDESGTISLKEYLASQPSTKLVRF